MTYKQYHTIKLNELRRGNLSILDHLRRERLITFEMIESFVAKILDVNEAILYTKTRLRKIAQARQLIQTLAHLFTKMSTTEIGRRTERDHSTVLHAKKTVYNLVETDRNFRNIYNNLYKTLKNEKRQI